MSRFREYYNSLDNKGKADFAAKLTENFGTSLSPKTIYNWTKKIAPTTPSANVCIFIADYFKTTPEMIFPFYVIKVDQQKRGVRQLSTL